MKRFPVFFLVAALLSPLVFAQQQYVGWSMGYLPNYANFSASKINWKCYTIITWFSVNGNGSGQVTGMSTSDATSFTSTCHQNNTKAVICVGGAGAGGSFASATTASVLPTFISNLITFMKQGNWDGIDIDWEDGVNSQFGNLIKGLNAAMANISPKPLLTIATADYLSGNSAPVASYADQLNLMSYYDGATSIPSEVKNFISAGVPKNKLGIGYGYDTDNEYDGPNEMGNGANGNPGDVTAHCDSVVMHGYGGIMVWEIDRAPAACDAATAAFVNKNAVTGIHPMSDRERQEWTTLSVTNDAGVSQIHYSVTAGGAMPIDLGLYDLRGSLVQNLVHGSRAPGVYSIPLGQTASGAIKPGAYVIRLGTPNGDQASTVILK